MPIQVMRNSTGVIRVQTEEFDQAGGVRVFHVKPAVFGNLHVRMDQHHQRIRDFLVPLREVAARTGVEQIVVIGAEIGAVGDRQEMIDVEDAADTTPLLAKQAVDAAKGKLVAKPGPIAGVIRIVRWPVTPDVRTVRVDERYRHFGDFRAAARASSS